MRAVLHGIVTKEGSMSRSGFTARQWSISVVLVRAGLCVFSCSWTEAESGARIVSSAQSRSGRRAFSAF